MSIETLILQIQNHEPILEAIKSKYVDTGLKYGWPSNKDKSYDFGHWANKIFYPNLFHPIDFYKSPYIAYHPEVANLWEIIKGKIDGPRALSTCYVSGYTYGTDAYIHVDNTDYYTKPGIENTCETAILYVNDRWDVDWAGETVVIDENKEIEASILPKPGRVILFDGAKPHGARPLSRACPVLRTIMAFKAINPEIVSEAASFLIDNVSDFRVNKKTYFEILYDGCTYITNLIKIKDLSSAVLYRGIYGTEEVYVNKEFPREKIRELIGDRAEYLAHEYSTMKNRRQALHTNANGYDEDTLEDLVIMDFVDARELYTGANKEEYDYMLQARDKVNKILNQKRQRQNVQVF